MLSTTLFALCALFSTTYAAPIKRTNTITAADIISIDPKTSSCANAPVAGQCRTAEQAAPLVDISFTNFGIADFNSQAALVALMLYESGDFQYSTNIYPGIAGQGTRNMQNPEDNLAYAEFLSTTCTNCGITSAQVQEAEAEGPAAVLDLVNTDEWSFGSAAWFLTTQCGESVQQGLAAGTQTGWENYLTECLRATVNDERNQLWSAAMALKEW
ncbi:hypothetical protein LTR36_002677 [Oleoguttula mirabilis]|uniref:Uncharacterized protein n=1 Tax=Oleoguttula mirabilis TaxID=1507867 RepID=A0AAV9JKL9_9PEZI|nr:hypothetical protein LTR36_002677 [Oleoguttula mirabilis]